MTRVASGAALLVGGVAAAPARAQYRTGITDSDPNDSPGYGRGGRPRTGVSDSDPNDRPGYGRGGGRPRTGLTDSDPNDTAGHGRGGGRK
ncbi:hypothetical protein [Roseococcus thiosulfatophilus]|uniref:hypothetical protein n=1 Tax=Roseococcus thiosulfatophilus TaxID=35813 RepID=UPI001A8D5A0F|nr:hypothetical protein [Roseococcus thiosulfatophilus]